MKIIHIKSTNDLPATAMRFYSTEWEAIAEAERIGADAVYHDSKTSTWFVVAKG